MLVAACWPAARAMRALSAREAGMNPDPQGSEVVNVQEGAPVHKAPLRPVGRSDERSGFGEGFDNVGIGQW